MRQATIRTYTPSRVASELSMSSGCGRRPEYLCKLARERVGIKPATLLLSDIVIDGEQEQTVGVGENRIPWNVVS